MRRPRSTHVVVDAQLQALVEFDVGLLFGLSVAHEPHGGGGGEAAGGARGRGGPRRAGTRVCERNPSS